MDRFSHLEKDLSQPAVNGFAVTPGASPLADVPRALWVGGAGDLNVTFLGLDEEAGNTVLIKGVTAGTVLPIRVTHVLAGTTATDIVALI